MGGERGASSRTGGTREERGWRRRRRQKAAWKFWAAWRRVFCDGLWVNCREGEWSACICRRPLAPGGGSVDNCKIRGGVIRAKSILIKCDPHSTKIDRYI